MRICALCNEEAGGKVRIYIHIYLDRWLRSESAVIRVEEDGKYSVGGGASTLALVEKGICSAERRLWH